VIEPGGEGEAMSTAERVLEVLSSVAETDEVRQNLEIPLFDLNILDSMKTVELMVAFSQKFGVEIAPAEFERDHWATPSKIVAYMESRVGA
jgi:D-alanine--poly(phosphoribitol) ligase subunit 2